MIKSVFNFFLSEEIPQIISFLWFLKWWHVLWGGLLCFWFVLDIPHSALLALPACLGSFMAIPINSNGFTLLHSRTLFLVFFLYLLHSGAFFVVLFSYFQGSKFHFRPSFRFAQNTKTFRKHVETPEYIIDIDKRMKP